MSDTGADDISAIVAGFENQTIARADWRHAEHLTVALFYVFHHDFETALVKMRGGIFRLLKAFEINFAKEMPYHETLTVFWLKTVTKFAESNRDRPLLEIRNKLIETFDKDYPLNFYSRELLFSDQARTRYLAGDL